MQHTFSRSTMDSNNLPSSASASAPRTFVNTLAHAQSTPAGVDGSGTSTSTSKTPPATPKKSGKMLGVRVQMLDDSITIFQVQAKAIGRLLFDQVCKQLNLLEADYFGLEYQDATTKYWLDFEKPLHRQVGLSLVDPLLRFCVKFYTPDPAQLEEEYTRYLFCLQIKRDLLQGDLQCNDNTAALIISYIVQAECGDFTPEDYPDPSYLSYHKFVPHQDRDLERKIMENHKKHVGQSPAEADLNLLETARRCELYGMIMHPAKDQEGVLLNLAVAHMGIVVFQNGTKINTFSWAKIRKISFKRKKFLIKLHPEGYGYYKDVVEFIFDNRNQCKSFWKKCVENHGFFRCSYVKRVPRQKARVLSRGSSFRYSGKTQKQMVAYVRENYVKRQTFQRSQSFRHQSSTHSSVVNVGASISAHPLLPLGENTIAGSGASLSCGSMTLSGSLSPTIAPDGGPPTAPIATTAAAPAAAAAAGACTTSSTAASTQQSHQTPADVHEPATTSSDITSIASQSPPHHHDTGQKAHYPYNFATNHFTEKLLLSTNTNNANTNNVGANANANANAGANANANVSATSFGGGPSRNARQRLRGAAVAVKAAAMARAAADSGGDGSGYDYDYDYDRDRDNKEDNVYTEFRFPMSSDTSKSSASVGPVARGVGKSAGISTDRGENLDDPDILKDLGKPGVGRGDDFAWQRSASCKELGMLYRQERLLKTDAAGGGGVSGSDFQRGDQASKFDSFRYCYSCHGQTPCFDRNGGRAGGGGGSGGVGSAHDQSEMKVYSSSYPGTGSTPHTSLESGDEEPVPPANVFIMDDDDDHHAGVTVTVEDEDEDDDNEGDEDYKKISQDDLSHDSYEVLEKEEEERVFGSRSSSVESDEMFIMENDYRSVSKHILWREGSDDVEKRLGYVEPRYRNIGFNEFNEICKRGFAARNRDTSQSHGNIKFSEFGTKGDHAGVGAGPGAPFESTRSSVISAIIGGHDMVSRTKSDPYMLKQKSSNKQKLYGLHQKSFELPPTEFNDVVEDDRFATSKSTVDIPYTLRIRNAMNGTARNADEASMYETNSAASAASASRSKSEVDLGSASSSAAACVRIGGGVEDSKRSDHGASQDSGLSLSLGTESVLDDTDIDFKNILMTKNNYEQVVTTKKSTKLMLSLSEENNENVAGHESSSTKAAEGDVVVVVAAAGKTSPRTESPQQPSVKSTSTGGGGGGGAGDKKERKSKSTLSADDIVVEKHITKVKSVECPRAKVHAAAAKIRKSRSAEAAYERKGSFLRTESSSGGGGSRGKKEIIVIDSDDYHSFDDSRSDKRSDGSDSVIIVEYRGNRRKKLSKKASSDSRGSQAESEASSFDAPRMKKKDLKKRNSTQGYFSKDRIPTIEISEDETYKAAAGGVDQAGAALVAIRRRCPQQQQYEYSSDERHASGSDLSKTEIINESQEEIKSPTSAATGGVVSPMTEDEVEKDLLIADGTNKIDKAQETPPPSTIAIAESAPQQPPAPPPPQFDKKDQKPPVPKKLKSLVAVAAAAAAVVTTANKTEIRNKEPVSSASKKLVGGEKSPILTRLGLSEGSATAQLNQQKLSPSAARRAKSLDTPIVSLHRLPPITSFSSKDDTVDNEEGVVLEEKTIKQVKSKLEPVSETTPIDTLPSAEPDLLRSSDQVVPNTKTAETNEESTSTTTTTTTTDTTVVQQPIDCGAADTCGPPPEPSRLRLSKELKRNSIAAVTMFKQSLDMKSAKKMESETLALSKERSKSEGYEKSLASSGCQTPERKHSTRQERLDSFKKLKNFSIELWESEDVDAAAAAAVAAAAAAAAKAKKFNTSTSKEYDDSVFDEELKSPRSPKPSSIPVVATASACEMPDKELPPLPADAIDDQSTSATESAGRPSTTSYTSDATAEDDTPEPPARVTSAAGAVATTAAATVAVAEAEAVTDTGAAAASVETPTGERKSLKLNLEGLFTPQQIQEMEIIQGLLNASPTTAESKAIPDKRSFDDEPSSSSSMQPDPLKPYPLESSGSSSVEEAILPPDYVDDEELPDVTNLNVMLDSADFLAGKSSATLTTSSFGSAGAFFSLSRTLSRISERSTTSEQERTTDMDEDSTKPLSRSLSIDDSIISSDQQPSFSSDPPSGMNLDHVFDEDDAAAAVAELDDDKLDFNIPPPLLSGDEEWPSPPHSAGSVKTPVIDNERYSAVAVPAALSAACSAISADADADADADAGAKKSEDDDSTTEDNKTLHDEEVEVEVISDHEEKMAFTKELQRPRGSVGDDTSAGITTSDWSSSTGTTIKQAHGFATYSKSEDNSLAGDYGVLSISTDTCVASESRKSSTDDLAPIPLEKKYLTLDRKQTSFERRQIFFPATFPSFEDEYDSPYTESEDTPSSPIPSHVLRKPPPPPRHFQTPAPALAPSLQQQQQQQPQPQPGPSSAAVVSSTAELAAGAVAMSVSPNSSAATAQKLMRTKCERNRAAKFLPHYTSSSMSTSLESPTSAERKFAKSVAKAKCYSYYSLARSPPSDGSSSSPEAPETPLTPNTIPRVSKRRRNPHTMRRRQQRAESHAKAFDYSTSPSSAHTPHTPKQFHYPPRRSRH